MPAEQHQICGGFGTLIWNDICTHTHAHEDFTSYMHMHICLRKCDVLNCFLCQAASRKLRDVVEKRAITDDLDVVLAQIKQAKLAGKGPRSTWLLS